MDKRGLKNTLFNMIQAVKRQHLILPYYTRAILPVCVWPKIKTFKRHISSHLAAVLSMSVHLDIRSALHILTIPYKLDADSNFLK